MAALALKQKLFTNHNLLIKQLEDKYNDYITNILKQKTAIILKIQKELYQEIMRIDNLMNNHIIPNIGLDNDSLCPETSISDSESSDDRFRNQSDTKNQHPEAPKNTPRKFKLVLKKSIKKGSKNNSVSRQTLSNDPASSDNSDQEIIAKKRSKRQKGKKWECYHCHKSLSSYQALTVHIRIHTGEKPFGCNYCNKRFRLNHVLTRHIRIHTGEKPFKCQACDKGFRQRSTLNKHLRIHTGERPFKCNKCNKRFRTSSSRSGHMKRCVNA